MMHRILIGLIVAAWTPVAFGDFSLDDDGKAMVIKEDGTPVLTYNYAPVAPPQGVSEAYQRSGYIHPLHGLDGEALTEDFPGDHYHHRGVFWAWPESKADGRKMDIWTLKGARSYPGKFEAGKVGEDAAITSTSYWRFDDAQDKDIVEETVSIQVHPAQGDGRAIDFWIAFKNVSEAPVTIQGSQVSNKGYGGFGIRPDSTKKPLSFTTAQGPVAQDETWFETPWTDLSFPAGKDGSVVGVAIFQHPGNPGYPHAGWLFRHYGYLGASWPHLEAHNIEAGESTLLRYRLFIHRGDAKAGDVHAAFEDYVQHAPSTSMK